MTPTSQGGTAGRLLRWMFVGRPPKKPPGKVNMAFLLLFPVWCSVMALTWGTMPQLITLAFICMGLSGVLGTLGSLALYHRWRGDRPGELLRLGSGLSGTVSMAFFFAHLVLNGQWGWFWWAVFVLALTTVVLVAGHFYGPNGGLHPEDGPPAGRNSSN